MKKRWWVAFWISAVLAVSTLIPVPFASKPCLLGYKAHCSFTPVSTVICGVIVWIIYWQGRKRGK